MLVNFERIKKIPCPLKLLNLEDLKTTFGNIADILLSPHDIPIVSLINPDVTGEKQQKDSLFELIRDHVISTITLLSQTSLRKTQFITPS